MNSSLQEIKDKIGNNDDFFFQRDYLGEFPVVLMGFKTLIDLTKTKKMLQTNINSPFTINKTMDEFLTGIGEVKEQDSKEAISSIMEGKLIVYLDNIPKFVIVEPVSKILNRAIEQPVNENVLQGPLNSFTEDKDTNIGIVRRQMNSDNIQVISLEVGNDQKKSLSLLYLKDLTNIDFVHKLIDQIKKNQDQELNHLQDLSKILGFSPWVAISKYHTTELPLEAVQFLKKGRVILFQDRLPFALVLPSLLWDIFTLENDRNYPLPLTIAIRGVRIIGLLMTLLIPGLYVALVAVNPEVLRIELALSIAQSREGVPYPALVEILMMLVILELILEASIRLPRSIGPTITMVGGIILGQAVVEAKLVSNLLIIILAATTIANSTVVGFQNSLTIRLFKYIIVILASIYGILGIVAGMVLVSAYLAKIKSFGIPYLNLKFAKDGIKSG
jgi:Bacillus/Clostridium GerA spore germination protein